MRVDPPGRATGQADRITELWAWTVIDPRNDVEGILGARLRSGAMPMVASTRSVIEKLAPLAREAAAEVGAMPMLRRFVPDE